MKDQEKTKIKRLGAHPLFKRHKVAKGSLTEQGQSPTDQLLMPNIEKKRPKAPSQSVKEWSISDSDDEDDDVDRLLANHIPLSERLKPKVSPATSKPETNMDRLKRTHGFDSKTRKKSKTALLAQIKNEAKAPARYSTSIPSTFTINPIEILGDDNDFSVSDLDDPDVISPWKPKQTYFRWNVGDTVEVAPPGKRTKDTLTDFCTIVGTNQDGTYNLQDIISDTYKKSVPESRIMGNYEDLFRRKGKTFQSKPKSAKKEEKGRNDKNQESDSDYDGVSDGNSESDDDDDDYRIYEEVCYV